MSDVEALHAFFREFNWFTMEQWATVHQVWRERREQGLPVTRTAIIDEIRMWKPDRRGFEQPTVEQVIAQLVERGFIEVDDAGL